MRSSGSFWVLVVAALCLSAGPARAEMYKYQDEQGNVHFVDSMAKIPAKYRKQLGGAYDPTSNVEKSTDAEPEAAEPQLQPPPMPGQSPNPMADQRERLREIKRQNCASDMDRLSKREKELEQQNAEWSASKKAESQIGESRGSIYCPGGNASKCIEEHEKYEAEEEAKRFGESPYKGQLETVRSQLERLRKDCRE